MHGAPVLIAATIMQLSERGALLAQFKNPILEHKERAQGWGRASFVLV
jgi:hypothetical protein